MVLSLKRWKSRSPPGLVVGARTGTHSHVTAPFRGAQAALAVAGWSSPVARQAHNLKVTGSNPVPATTPVTSGPSRERRAFMRFGVLAAASAKSSILKRSPSQAHGPRPLPPLPLPSPTTILRDERTQLCPGRARVLEPRCAAEILDRACVYRGVVRGQSDDWLRGAVAELPRRSSSSCGSSSSSRGRQRPWHVVLPPRVARRCSPSASASPTVRLQGGPIVDACRAR